MNGLNRLTIIGNSTKDAVSKETNVGVVTEFTVAVNEHIKDRSGRKDSITNYFKCNIWGEWGIFFAEKIKKGTLVCVDGSINFKTKEIDGIVVTFSSVNCSKVILLDRGDGNE
jgi:single stranded DNA-binding protein